MSNIVKGTMLLTGATFLSKFLGMIYVIPFNELVGPEGGALFLYGYVPYTILLSISTVGVPLAVSKFVSKYNALGDYQTGLRIFKSGMTLMTITGFIAFLILFLGADFIAELTKDKEDKINTIDDVAMVIRMVSFALIVVPAMSIVRGFFQGYESMGPTAVSQVVEQIMRIVFLLSATFVIIVFLNGDKATAVGFATFATFIGALASCVVLYRYWKKRKSFIYKNIEQQQTQSTISTLNLFKELFQYAGPFVLVGIATPLYQQVDLLTFNSAMSEVGLGKIADIALGTINLYGHKLIIIPVALATGLSLSILPALTKSFNEGNKTAVFKQINQALQIVVVLTVPAVVGLSVLSDVAYGSLYGLYKIELTGSLLGWYAPVGLLFALFLVTASILQGINQQRFAVVSLSGGLLIKILFNIPLIHMFGAKGAIFGTALAVGTAVSLNLWRIGTAIEFSYKQTLKRTMLVCIFTLCMTLALIMAKLLVGAFVPYESSRVGSVIMLIVGIITGGGTYLCLGYQSTLLERVLGNKVRVFDRFLKR